MATDRTAYWSEPLPDLLVALESGPDGLTAESAADRLRRSGGRAIEDQGQRSAAALLARQFASPLVLILVFAAVISLFLQEWVDAGIVLAIVLGSTLLAFFQEYRASRAVADLRRRIALTAKVRRQGSVAAVPFAELVPGDIVLLRAGDMAPADCVVVEALDLLVSQAALTGESFPVEKRPGVVSADAAVAERTNVLFLGTSVRSGTGEAVVVRTGRDTEFGAVAARLRSRPPETEFARGVRRFGAMLVRVMVLMVLFVLTVNQLLWRPFIESLLFAVALAVGLSPELLPAIVTVTLSAGARQLAKGGVIVRRLEAIEDLGGMTVLCTDKTGTLTEGLIQMVGATDPTGAASPRVALLGFLNASFEAGIENPLDQAIVEAGKTSGLTTGGYAKVAEIPYSFFRKRLSVVVAPEDASDSPMIITKGALEPVLGVCATVAGPDGPRPLDAATRDAIGDYYQRRGEEGLRVLGLASRTAPVRTAYGADDETDLCFEGFLVFMDPPRPEAGRTIAELAALGVQVKVISGDNRHVTAHVAAALGLDPGSILTGEQLAATKDEALWNLAQRTTLFVEIDPQQKERIVRALQRTGHAVGFLGDGINDAPALHAADVGISVSGATDVARESADVVLLRRDLGIIRQGVQEGRRTYANTLKYICITTSANFGNMVSMALAAPLLPFLPLLAKQILLNNFLSDLPVMAISGDQVDAERVSTAQRWDLGEIQRFMIVFGLISSAFDVLSFALLLLVFKADAGIFQTAWFVISLMTELAVLLVLRTRGPAWRSRPGTVLLGLTVAVAATAVALPYMGVFAAGFGFVALPLHLLAGLLMIVLLYAGATEAAKLWLFRNRRAGRPA